MGTVLVSETKSAGQGKTPLYLARTSFLFAIVGVAVFCSGRLPYLCFSLLAAAIISGLVGVVLCVKNKAHKKAVRGGIFGVAISLIVLVPGIAGFHSGALKRAIGRGDVEQIKVLIDRGYDVNAETGGGQNMLTRAFWYPYPNKKFFSDAPIVKVTKQNREKKVLEVLELLLAHGADINALDDHGWAPIHCAINTGYYNAVQFLIENGADVNLKDRIYASGLTPLQWALEQGKEEIAELLRKHGAEE